MIESGEVWRRETTVTAWQLVGCINRRAAKEDNKWLWWKAECLGRQEKVVFSVQVLRQRVFSSFSHIVICFSVVNFTGW